jgi:hypothetical protein
MRSIRTVAATKVGGITHLDRHLVMEINKATFSWTKLAHRQAAGMHMPGYTYINPAIA